MGNEPPKKTYNPKDQKQKLEIACLKVKGHLEIQRDRRIAQANGKEQQLIKMLNNPTRSKEEELHKASSIVTDIAYIDSCNLTIRYCDIIKDRSLLICESKGNSEAIKDLMPYIESLVYSSKHLNLNSMQEFSALMIGFFGSEKNFCSDDSKVAPELKENLNLVMPTQKQISDYLYKLSVKAMISVNKINEVGHEVYSPNEQPQAIFVPQFQQFPNNNNVNINIRVQDQPPLNYPYNQPPQANFNQPYPQNNFVPPQNNFNPPQNNFNQPPPQNNFNQSPPPTMNQQFQNQFQAPQNNNPPQQFPQMDQPVNNQPPPQFNFPKIQMPVFNFSPQPPTNQNVAGTSNLGGNQNFGGNQNYEGNQNFGENQNLGGNPGQQPNGSDDLEERLRRLREGM